MPHGSGSPEPATDKTGEGSSPPRRGLLDFDVLWGPDGLRAGWSLLLFLALRELLKYVFYPLAGALFPAVSPEAGLLLARPLLLYEAAGLLTVVIATWIMARIERRPNSTYGLGGQRRLGNFLAGLGWGVALLSLLIFSLRASGFLVFDGRMLFGRSAIGYALVWLAGFLLVGFFEEYLSRGFAQFTLTRGLSGIYRWLRVPHADGLGFWTAAFCTSFYFAFGHTTNAGESPIGLLAAGLIGGVFCLSLWRTGSLWWAIGFHASWDWAQSFLYGVADSGSMAQGHLFATHPVGHAIFSGGTTGPEGSLLILPVVGVAAIVILVTLPAKRHERASS